MVWHCSAAAADEWNLGGMGNPNAIVIEGDERLCIKYTDIMIQ